MTGPALNCTPALGSARRERLAAARLYLVCDAAPGGRPLRDVLPAAAAGGVDIVQLRDKELDDDALLDAAVEARELCAALDVLLIVNDRPRVAVRAGADGVHVGQDDAPVGEVRAIVGEDMLIGLSTHTPAQVDAAQDVDYIGVGPVYPTPTKPGRPEVGTTLVGYAGRCARIPFFAIGGITERNVGDVVAAGARRIAVVRAIAEAEDPRAAAAALRRALEGAADG